jgi:dihydroorotase-like cyclic amidohydrolase
LSGGGGVILPTGIARADVVVDGEKIRTVASDAIDVGFDREIEAEGCYLLPGGVDPHVHTNLESSTTLSVVEEESIPKRFKVPANDSVRLTGGHFTACDRLAS